ncbi:MAG: biotin carboxylase N-terminal domain-containing protein [Saprospiraceae bacterium]
MPKLLVANRGEIAIRIFKSARKRNWTCVAIYSEADKESLHLEYADEIYSIGPAPASQSYLNIEKIIAVAREAKVDFIHPGYGFLSENAKFVKAVSEAGIHFIGPGIDAMNLLGNKISAKKLAHSLGIPLVPGNQYPISETAQAIQIANEIGFPVMIKAAAGGGGKGMRMIEEAAALSEGIELAKAEAKASFGNDDIFIERLIKSPRHIEIQIIADTYGNVLGLPERECSLQRRHQKIMEESPANHLSADLRSHLIEDAIKLASKSGYVSTGTVEFIIDNDGHYYFLEMNTRLQVEHTVTEMVTGLDLVDLQFDIAEGKPLVLTQNDLIAKGHAIQWRVYAEDPDNHFTPSTGKINSFNIPVSPHIRIDAGYKEGKVVSVYYDPMIAKLIAWSPDRASCVQLLRSALDEFEISGIITSIPFGILVLDHPSIVSGDYHVNFLDQELNNILHGDTQLLHSRAAAALALYLHNVESHQVVLPAN